MNIVNKLTIRHLKLNKRRTLVTMMGVIISVAMITAVATFVVSFMGMMQQEVIKSTGNWHVLYKNVNSDQVQTIRNDQDTKTTILSRDIGFALLDGGKNQNKPYLQIKEYNQEGFENFPINITEGRFPESATEIVISESIANNGDVHYQVGDKLNLNIGKRYMHPDEGSAQTEPVEATSQYPYDATEEFKPEVAREYTIVGVIEQPPFEYSSNPGYTVLSYLNESTLKSTDTVNLSVELKNPTGKIYDQSYALAEKIGLSSHQNDMGTTVYDDVEFNRDLLMYSGITSNDSFQSTLYGFAAIILIIIMVGSISLIYNAFSISISERSRHLGMLASVGATKAQKRKSVFFEGALIGGISIPLGLLFGTLGMGVTFAIINPILNKIMNAPVDFQLIVSPSSIIIAVLFSILTITLSTYIPARRASKITPIDAIRQTQDIKLKSKQVKTSKLTRKLFGFEAELALKNLKRNKRRYKATIFSLVISIVLFLAVSSFMNMFQQSIEMSQQDLTNDIYMQTRLDYSVDQDKQIIDHIASIQDVDDAMISQTLYASASLKPEFASQTAKDLYEVKEDGTYDYSLCIIMLDDQKFDAYAKKAGVDPSALRKADQFAGILLNDVTYADQKNNKFIQTNVVDMSNGDQFAGNLGYDSTDMTTFTAAGVTSESPDMMDVSYGSTPNVMMFFVPESTFSEIIKILPEENRSIRTTVALQTENPTQVEKDIQTIVTENSITQDVYINNVHTMIQQQEQMNLIIQIFVYGFIILITGICVANIFNTISTSISLRKREFAMLKSVGMTPKGFNRMINYESIFYGIKALLFGLPISFISMLLMYKSLSSSFSFAFPMPWMSLLIVVVAVFVIVGTTMLYSIGKVKKENIIDALKEENI